MASSLPLTFRQMMLDSEVPQQVSQLRLIFEQRKKHISPPSKVRQHPSRPVSPRYLVLTEMLRLQVHRMHGVLQDLEYLNEMQRMEGTFLLLDQSLDLLLIELSLSLSLTH